MKEDEKIDGLLSSLINSAPIDTTNLNEDWNAVKAGLNKKNKKRFIWWWFILLGLIGLVGIAQVFWSLSAKNSSELTAVTSGFKNKVVRNNNDTTFTKKSKMDFSLEEIDNKSPTFEISEVVSNITRGNQTSKSKQSRINKSNSVSQLKIGEEKKDKFLDENIISSTIDSTLVFNLDYYSKNEAKLIVRNYNNEIIDFSVEEPRIRKSSLSFYFEPTFVSPIYNQNILKDNYQPISSYSLGGDYNFKIRNKLSLSFGVNYSKLGFNYHNHIDTIPTPSPTPAPSLGIAYTTSSNSDYESLSQENLFLYRASYLSLSTGINFLFLEKKKIGAFVIFAPEINFLLSEQGEIQYSSKVSSSLNFGIGANYKLANSIGLFLQPTIKYMYLGYNTINESTIDPFVLGIRTGINIKF